MKGMKTAEEILLEISAEQCWAEAGHGDSIEIMAMKAYAQQENEKLREALRQAEEAISSFYNHEFSIPESRKLSDSALETIKQLGICKATKD
jgi:hypothetical protein